MILDSGAFSAYTKGVVIDIDKYAAFSKANINAIGTVVNLDSINPGDPLAGAELSMRNFRYLRDQHGIKSMPVFHVRENIRYLYTMIEEADYIGLAVRSSTKGESAVFDWYNSIWPLITDNNGFPLNRFHAFGDTSFRSLLQYPWYSADSSTWAQMASRGAWILINDTRIQWRAQTAQKDGRKTSDITDDGEKRLAWDELFFKAGLNPSACATPQIKENDKWLIRMYYNAFYFLELEKRAFGGDRYYGPPPIENRRWATGGTVRANPPKVHFVLSSSGSTDHLAVIAQLGITNVLLSYFYVTQENWDGMMVPFLYDPIKTARENPKVAKKVEILNKYLLKPVIA